MSSRTHKYANFIEQPPDSCRCPLFRSAFVRQSATVQLAIVWLSAFLTLLSVIKLYMRATTRNCASEARLEGKTVLITGANTGRARNLLTIASMLIVRIVQYGVLPLNSSERNL